MSEKYLKKIGAIDEFTLELDISKSNFIRKLGQNISEDERLFPWLSDILSSNDILYKGTVDIDSFKIRRKQTLFSRGQNMGEVSGKFKSTPTNSIAIEVEVNSFSYVVFISLILGILIYGLIVVLVVYSIKLLLLYQVLILGSYLLWIFLLLRFYLYLAKKNTASLRRDVERELHYLTRQ